MTLGVGNCGSALESVSEIKHQLRVETSEPEAIDGCVRQPMVNLLAIGRGFRSSELPLHPNLKYAPLKCVDPPPVNVHNDVGSTIDSHPSGRAPAQGCGTKSVPRQGAQHSASFNAITARQLQALVRQPSHHEKGLGTMTHARIHPANVASVPATNPIARKRSAPADRE